MPTSSEMILANLQASYGTQNLSSYNVRRQMQYDYVRYNVAGVTNLQFFQVPLGGTDPVSTLSKTLEQTNLGQNAQLVQNFVLAQIRTHLFVLPKKRQAAGNVSDVRFLHATFAPAALAIYDLSGQGVLIVGFGAKQYFDIDQPFRTCPPGFGPDILQAPASAAAVAIPQNQWFAQSNNPEDVYAITPPVMIEKSQTMSVNIAFPNGTSPTIPQVNSANINMDIGVIFDGLILEPTQ